tara:strand:+ start:203 stop:577 length:375 start_codon:yes stop_codon:yes gene_type:complete
MLKKLYIIFFILFSFNSVAVEKKTNFTFDTFTEANKSGKTIVINSWNKYCGTCAKQVKILKEAEKDFPDILFLYYEQNKHKDIAKLLDVQYWATIIVYKNSKEVVKEIGVTSKKDIYSLIKKEI